jgi:hypothetical protein
VEDRGATVAVLEGQILRLLEGGILEIVEDPS